MHHVSLFFIRLLAFGWAVAWEKAAASLSLEEWLQAGGGGRSAPICPAWRQGLLRPCHPSPFPPRHTQTHPDHLLLLAETSDMILPPCKTEISSLESPRTSQNAANRFCSFSSLWLHASVMGSETAGKQGEITVFLQFCSWHFLVAICLIATDSQLVCRTSRKQF